MHDFMAKYKKILCCVAVFVIAGIFYSLNVMPQNDSNGFTDEIKISASDDEKDSYRQESVSVEPEKLYVYVCGEVSAPGVYMLLKGDRVVDALEAAGGVTANANIVNLNLAGAVDDGMRIYVPDKSVAVGEEGMENTNGLVNINTATKEQLMTLPGIGQSRAEDIIAYRKSNGRFKTIDELMQVPGIKEGAFSKIKEYITVL